MAGAIVAGALWMTGCQKTPDPPTADGEGVQVVSSQAAPNRRVDPVRQVRADVRTVKEQTASVRDNDLQRAQDLQAETDAKLAKLDRKNQADVADVSTGIALRIDMAASRIDAAKDSELQNDLKVLRTKFIQASAANGNEQAQLYKEVMADLEVLEAATARLSGES